MDLFDQTGGGFIEALKKSGKANLAINANSNGSFALNLVDSTEAIKKEQARKEKLLNELSKLTWKELDLSGKLEQLKDLDVAVFRAKFKEHFGKEMKS